MGDLATWFAAALPWDARLFFGALAVSFVCVATRIRSFRRNIIGFQCGKEMGPPDWDFKSSWASTLTVAGAVIGAIVAEPDLFPESPTLSRAAYSGLSILFALMAVLAPLFYSAFRIVRKPVALVPFRGRVWAFLVASAITLWAACGELFMAALLLWDIRTKALFSTPLLVAIYGSARLRSCRPPDALLERH